MVAAGGGGGKEGSNPLTKVTVISLAPAVGIPVRTADKPTCGPKVATIFASLEFLMLTTIPLEVVRV